MTNYGSDTIAVSDLPLIDLQTNDPALVIGQRVARRLLTPRGALANIGDDPNFGWDVRQYLNGKISPTTISIAQAQVLSEVLKDEEVKSGIVDITLDNNGSLVVSISMVSAAGPFSLTLNVSQLTAGAVFNF